MTSDHVVQRCLGFQIRFRSGEFKDEVQHGSEIHETPGAAS